MPSLVDECLLGKNKFKNFLEVIEECGIKTGYDFIHFMSVTKEHCIDKGVTDYDEVKRIWEEHKESIKQIIENSKKSDIIGIFTDKDGNKTPIMKMAGLFPEDIDKYPDDLYYKDKRYLGNLYADKETYDWLTTPSEDDDDIGYYPSCCTELDDEAFDEFEKDVMNPEINEEKVEAAKQIFEGIENVEVKKENIDD